jgi:hypothetical protein
MSRKRGIGAPGLLALLREVFDNPLHLEDRKVASGLAFDHWR